MRQGRDGARFDLGVHMDSLLEFLIKVGLALVVIWMFQRISWILAWYLQPFFAGFIAGILVALLFAIRLRRPGSGSL
jgi:hypothetical protein